MNEKSDRSYLGDGVYANFDGVHIILTTEDGVSVTNTIYFDPYVVRAFNEYQKLIADKYYKSEETNDTRND